MREYFLLLYRWAFSLIITTILCKVFNHYDSSFNPSSEWVFMVSFASLWILVKSEEKEDAK